MTDEAKRGTVAHGRALFSDQRMPSRQELDSEQPATTGTDRGRRMFAARGDRAATLELLHDSQPGEDT